MKNLLPGLRKFSQGIFPKRKEFFTALAQGQKPHTLLITCSDSRIDPNLITQTNPGEIFIVRNAGNIVPPYGASRGGEEAAIEFAIEGLGVNNIVICGHWHCGAMAALVNQADLEGLSSVKAWLGHANATKKRFEPCNESTNLTEVVQENVLVQVDNLKTHPSVSVAHRNGRIHIFAWVYNFESGTISIYDPALKKYLLSTAVREESENNTSRFAL